MSEIVGSHLPEDLFERLRGANLDTRVGLAVLVVTTDDAGWPHPAMVSYGELVATDIRHLRLAVRRTSRTAANLRRNGRLTLCFIEADMVYYVKTAVTGCREPIPGFPRLARFDSTVETVLLDAAPDSEPGVSVCDGIRFSLDRSPAALLRDWDTLRDALRETA